MDRDQVLTRPDLGSRLFSFAVIADTHVNHAETATNSVYPVNALHNGRFRHVIREINNQENLDFIVHLGDMVHPVPAIPDLFGQACDRYREIAAESRLPIHVLPGNHDVGDKPVDWTPAICVADEFLQLYREQFGSDFYAFQHKGVHFVQLNAPLLNSGLASEAKQRDWAEQYFDTHRSDRFVVNFHYPVFLADRNEDSHYDNIDEPGRTWLLDLLERYSVEMVFTGHVHNFWYQRYAEADIYCVPSTGCIRQDYSEMARTPPAAGMEGGRNDQPKHGYFLIHVHQRGHTCQIMRTYGAVAEPGTDAPPALPKVRPLHPLENWRAPVGFDMRQDWMEVVQVPPSGGPDEFNRKRARNDYPVMAFWEMGVRRLRLPKLDFQDPVRRQRLRALRDRGHEFVLCSYGIPDAPFLEMLAGDADLASAWEIAFPWADLPMLTGQIASLRQDLGIPIFLSKLRGKDEHEDGSSKFVHAINHGFIADEADQIAKLAEIDGVDGAVFRVGSAAPTWDNIIAAGELCARVNLSASLIVRLSEISPAEYRKDDLWTANRVCEAMAAATTQKNVHVILDTFADFDRGYFRRNGVVDRLYNPRLGFHAIRHLYGALNAEPGDLTAERVIDTERVRFALLKRNAQSLVLAMPKEAGTELKLPSEFGSMDWSCTDLHSGEILSSIPSRIEAPVLLTR